MRLWNQHRTFLITMSFILIATGGCGSNPFSSDGVRYQVLTIDMGLVGNISIDEHVSRWRDFGEDRPSSIPIELWFDTLPPGAPYAGKVLLAHNEWKDIENPSGSKESFDVVVSNRQTHPDTYEVTLTFSQLKVQDDSLSGRLSAWGPSVDGLPSHFTALRK